MSYRLHAIILPMKHRNGRHPTKSLGAALALASCLAAPNRSVLAEDLAAADRVVVHKAEHKLYLYSGSRLLGEYKVQLGLSPSGQKEREHDFRTPEGRYTLARRNTRSDYFLAIQVSYPNKDDEVHAHKNHWAPGGSIMISLIELGTGLALSIRRTSSSSIARGIATCNPEPVERRRRTGPEATIPSDGAERISPGKRTSTT